MKKSSNRVLKGLAAAVTLGLLTGMYMPQADAKEYVGDNGSAIITGSSRYDKQTFGDSIFKKNPDGSLVYTFVGDNSFSNNAKYNSSLLSLKDADAVINSSGTLTFRSNSTISGSNGSASSVSVSGMSNVTINGNLDIQSHSKSYAASGISVNGGKLNVNGNVVMRNNDVNNPWGVTTGTIHGGYGPDGWVSDASGYVGSRWAPAGISIGSDDNSVLNLNGNVDVAVKGYGVLADCYNDGVGTINMNKGDIRIETPKSTKDAYYSVGSFGGTININNEGKYTVDIKGNMIAMDNSNRKGEPYFFENGTINLTMANNSSKWVGVIDNTGADQAGEINLTLKNEALWQHESMGKTNGMDALNMPTPSNEGHYGVYDGISHVNKLAGGSSVANRGAIMQADKAGIKINEYSGHTIVMYAHSNNGENTADYIGGDVVIKSAAVGSGITLSTDSKGINLQDLKSVDKVLNALAGKLTYENFVTGENNLTGRVQIAEGLTSSSISRDGNNGDITFNKETGKGQYVSTRIETAFTQGITGDENVDTDYRNNIQADGTYKFASNSSVTTTGGASAVNATKDLTIDATGKMLELNSSGVEGEVFALNANNKNVNITAGKLVVTSKNDTMRADGIRVSNSTSTKSAMNITADVDVNAYSGGGRHAVGVYAGGNAELNINGNLTMVGKDGAQWGIDNKDDSVGDDRAYYKPVGIYAGYDYGGKHGGTVNVNGDVNLAVNGTGVLVNGNSAVNINGGGSIVTNKDAKNAHYALAAQSGTINVNMSADKTAAGNKGLKLEGNIGLLTEGYPQGDSIINVGLATKDSVLTGVVVNNYNETLAQKGHIGEANLYLSNGATWNNAIYGVAPQSFEGSKVNKFVGGKDAASVGYVFQQDAGNINIKDYSGHTKFFYAYDVRPDGTVDFSKLGDTVIDKAAEGSFVTMVTDSKGITMTDTAKVEAALGALADKLVYNNSAVDKNLSGKLEIAEGLTSSSVTQYVGDIEFGTDHRGDLVAGSAKPVDPPVGPNKPGGDMQLGEYENSMMVSVRSAMMDSMLAWRDNAAQMFDRTDALRNGAEDGAWVKTYGGKTKYTGENTEFNNSYWAAQFGYDRKLANGWNVGAAVDYREGDGSYMRGGEGEHTVYSIGAYATKDLGSKGYVDVNIKGGHADNEFTVYNNAGIALDGDYATRGYSASVQYGKHFADEGGAYFEPQVQLTWAHLDGQNYYAQSKTHGALQVNRDAFDSFVGRVGFEFGKSGEKGGMYARVSLNHEFAGDVDGSYYAKDGGLKNTSYDLGGTWSEVSLGGNYQLNETSSVFADVTKGLFGDYKHQWKVNAGLNFTF